MQFGKHSQGMLCCLKASTAGAAGGVGFHFTHQVAPARLLASRPAPRGGAQPPCARQRNRQHTSHASTPTRQTKRWLTQCDRQWLRAEALVLALLLCDDPCSAGQGAGRGGQAPAVARGGPPLDAAATCRRCSRPAHAPGAAQRRGNPGLLGGRVNPDWVHARLLAAAGIADVRAPCLWARQQQRGGALGGVRPPLQTRQW